MMSRRHAQRRGAWLALVALAFSLLLPAMAGALQARTPAVGSFGPVCSSLPAGDAPGQRDDAPSAPSVHHAGQPACGCPPCAPAALPGRAAAIPADRSVGFVRLAETADGQPLRPGVRPPLPARGPPAG